MQQFSRILKFEDCYLLPDPVYLQKVKYKVDYSLSDEERVVLYWAGKRRSYSFIQGQLMIDALSLSKTVGKLRDQGKLRVIPANSQLSELQAIGKFMADPAKLNLKHLWEKKVDSFPDDIYILDKTDNAPYTYKEFDEIVKSITSTFTQRDIRKGDKIILYADLRLETIALFWGCMQLGVVFMPLNSSLAEIVVEGVIEKHNPKAIFLSQNAAFRERWANKTILFDHENNIRDSAPDNLYFSKWLKSYHEIQNLPEIFENDLAAILHTSGSTGEAKGVKLGHGQLYQSAINITETYRWSKKDSFITTNDLDSITGLRTACTATVAAGGMFIIPSIEIKNNPAELLDCIYHSGITCLSTGPSLLKQLLSRKDVKTRLEKVTCITSAGSALTRQLKTEFFEKTGKQIFNLYGLTETAGLTVCVDLHSNNLNGNFIGYPVDCIAKIVNEDNDNVRVGEIGELVLYGYTVFKGYYSDNEPNANKIHQWFFTGDLAKMNFDGSIELAGRKKDFMKNARGEIVYFNEIEDALKPFSFIKDIGIVAFFQNESERAALFIEMDNNFVAPKNIVEEVKRKLTTTIGTNKIPSIIKTIEKIPRNKYGKLLQAELNQYL